MHNIGLSERPRWVQAQQVSTRVQLLAVLDAIERWLPPEQYADKLHLEEFTMSPKECLTRELEEYGDEREARGEARGAILGRTEGRAEGQRSVLSKLLKLKFGPLPAAAQERVARAGSPELEAWADRVLTAASLDEIWSE